MMQTKEESGEQCTCRLCINVRAPSPTPQSFIVTHSNSLVGSVTINAKTTVHCSPESSIGKRMRTKKHRARWRPVRLLIIYGKLPKLSERGAVRESADRRWKGCGDFVEGGESLLVCDRGAALYSVRQSPNKDSA